ncbi:MAG: hypothetical protein AB7G06_03700 [Bdellovibrionales bacterium]
MTFKFITPLVVAASIGGQALPAAARDYTSYTQTAAAQPYARFANAPLCMDADYQFDDGPQMFVGISGSIPFGVQQERPRQPRLSLRISSSRGETCDTGWNTLYDYSLTPRTVPVQRPTPRQGLYLGGYGLRNE